MEFRRGTSCTEAISNCTKENIAYMVSDRGSLISECHTNNRKRVKYGRTFSTSDMPFPMVNCSIIITPCTHVARAEERSAQVVSLGAFEAAIVSERGVAVVGGQSAVAARARNAGQALASHKRAERAARGDYKDIRRAEARWIRVVTRIAAKQCL